jgi:hypothetical protein
MKQKKANSAQLKGEQILLKIKVMYTNNSRGKEKKVKNH